MDSTLTQLLSGLYQAHADIVQLNARIAQLEAELAARPQPQEAPAGEPATDRAL